jgi:hypothetical protein
VISGLNTWNNWSGGEVGDQKSEVTVEVRSSAPGFVISLEE